VSLSPLTRWPNSLCHFSDDLEKPYDFSLVDYEFFPEEDGQHRKELLKSIQHNYYATLEESLIVSSNLTLNIYHDDILIGDVKVKPLIDDYKVNFELSNQNPVKKSLFDKYIKIFKYPELIKCWYESGHALVNGMVFKTGYRDVEYSGFLWTYFDRYDITKEKPGKDKKKPELKNIGKSDSLFCWVQQNWNGEWIERGEFALKDKPKGWLYCDDGAGEKADFIHVVEYKKQVLISLIHVKAAKSNSDKRKISVGVHDVVLNQAVKNLRYCNRKTLASALKERSELAEKKYCWKDSSKQKAKDFITYLNSIGNISNIKTRVVVIQPHTRKSVYENTSQTNIKKQLDVLLVSAENAIRSSGSEFHIFGVQD